MIGVALSSRSPFQNSANMVKMKEAEIIEQDSNLLTRNLLRTAIFNISYIKGLFPEKYFNDKSVPALGQTLNLGSTSLTKNWGMILKPDMKLIMPMDARLIDWMEKGVYDALQRKYLKKLMFCICETVGGPMIEEYSFSFSYSDSDVMMNINRRGTFNSTADITPNQMRSSACKMVRTLVQLMRTLHKMPDEGTIVMKLLYYDDVTINELRAEEDVADMMKLTEPAVTFELEEATQRVNDAEIALQRAEMALSISHTSEETHGQPLENETCVEDEVVFSSTIEDVSHQDGELSGVQNASDLVPDKLTRPYGSSDHENGKPSVESSKVVEAGSDKLNIVVQTKKQKDLPKEATQKSLSISHTSEETHGQPLKDETCVEEEVVFSSTVEDVSHQVGRESLIDGELSGVQNVSDLVPDKLSSDHENGKPSVESSKVVEAGSEKPKIVVQETQKDLTKEASSINAHKASSSIQQPSLYNGMDGASYCLPNPLDEMTDSKGKFGSRLRRNVVQSCTLTFNVGDSLEELKELLHKAIKELEVTRLNSTMFVEKAQRMSENVIAFKNEAAGAWDDINKTLDVIRDTVDKESVAKEAVQKATMALSMAEARLRVAVVSEETENRDDVKDKEGDLIAAKYDLKECQVNLANCEAQLSSLKSKKDELQKEVDKLNELAETLQNNALRAEENVANMMKLAEPAVAFELESIQRVTDAEIALQRAEKALFISHTPEETHGQPLEDEEMFGHNRKDITVSMLKNYPQLLRKFMADKTKAPSLVEIIMFMILELYSLKRQEQKFKAAVRLIKDAYFKHWEREALSEGVTLKHELIDKLTTAIKQVKDGTEEYSLLVNLERFYELQLSQPVLVESIYDKIHNVRNLDQESPGLVWKLEKRVVGAPSSLRKLKKHIIKNKDTEVSFEKVHEAFGEVVYQQFRDDQPEDDVTDCIIHDKNFLLCWKSKTRGVQLKQGMTHKNWNNTQISGPVRDQKNHFLCAAFVVADSVSATKAIEYNKPYEKLSVKEICFFASPEKRKELQGYTHQCHSMSMQDAFNYVRDHGIGIEEGNDDLDCTEDIPEIEGEKTKIKGSKFLGDKLTDILPRLKIQPLAASVIVFEPEYTDALNNGEVYRGPTSTASKLKDFHGLLVLYAFPLGGEIAFRCKSSQGADGKKGGYIDVSGTTMLLGCRSSAAGQDPTLGYYKEYVPEADEPREAPKDYNPICLKVATPLLCDFMCPLFDSEKGKGHGKRKR